jgi:uncharacterized protein
MKTQLNCAVTKVTNANVRSTQDGAIILNGRPLRTGDYEYWGFELDGVGGRMLRYDDRLVGRMEQSTVDSILSTFKGLPITDGHWFVPVGERGEYAVGTVLNEGKMDSEWVEAEHLIHEPKSILKINNESALELSVGFESNIRWSNGGEGEPDFYIEDVELNHVALVAEGRAGPEGRLQNHKAKLENEMKPITIGDKTFQVDDAVAAEFSRLSSAETDLNTKLSNSTSELATATASLANVNTALLAATAQRDAAQGQVSVANAELITLRNSAPDIAGEAVKIANAHTAFAAEAVKMGYDKDLSLGSYDENAVKLELLNARGAALPAEASTDMVNGAWRFALANASAAPGNHSVLDKIQPNTGGASVRDEVESRVSSNFYRS